MSNPYSFELSLKVKFPWFINNSLCLFIPPGFPDLQTYMSSKPSPLMSTNVEPVDQIFEHETPADSVISSNFQFPLLRKSLLSTILPVKYISMSPSLFMSPKETPAPL